MVHNANSLASSSAEWANHVEETQPKPRNEPVAEAQDTSAIGILAPARGGRSRAYRFGSASKKGGTRKILCTTVELPTPNGYMELTQQGMKGTTPQARTISRESLDVAEGKMFDTDWIVSLDQPLERTPPARRKDDSSSSTRKEIFTHQCGWIRQAHTPGHESRNAARKNSTSDLDDSIPSLGSIFGAYTASEELGQARNSPPPMTDDQVRLGQPTPNGWTELKNHLERKSRIGRREETILDSDSSIVGAYFAR